jgi:hypothetical protein
MHQLQLQQENHQLIENEQQDFQVLFELMMILLFHLHL